MYIHCNGTLKVNVNNNQKNYNINISTHLELR
jgi:hypothetical protein